VVTVSEHSVFPAPREDLWKVLRLHLDDEVITRIHPNIQSQKRVGAEGDRSVMERTVRYYGRTFGLTVRYDMVPPERFRWEIIGSTAGVTPGSYVENRYEDAGSATNVNTRGEMTLRGVPKLLEGLFVSRLLGQADTEDLRYLRKLRI